MPMDLKRNILPKLYYPIKPFISRKIQLRLRRFLVAISLKKHKNVWPINQNASKKPDWFKGWPDGKRFALIITHDVEKSGGLEKLDDLLSIDEKYSIRSCVGLVPELYPHPMELFDRLHKRDKEVYVHDLNHDGKLFSNYATFHKRAVQINKYIRDWKVKGFRAGAMHHNLNWIGELNIDYDMSTFDTDPFEPMPDGVGSIFPFVTTSPLTSKCYVEIPYTLPQDIMMLILHPKRSINLWIEKLDWIVEHNGMVSLNVHPDYIAFTEKTSLIDTYPAAKYDDFLSHICKRFGTTFWNPHPSEMSRFILKTTQEYVLSLQLGNSCR
jgi:hypothetical protein